MSLTLTPAQLSRRAEFYQQLAQLVAAGVGLLDALSHLAAHPPSPSYREPIEALRDGLSRGSTFSEVLRESGHWAPVFDIALLQAGEQSGRMDACFRLLANYYADRARLARQMLADLAYPVALLHFAVFILPFSQLFVTGDWLAYLFKTAGILLPIYAVVAALVLAGQGSRGERWRAWMEAVLRGVPVLGRARAELALARLSAAMEALLSAGVNIIEAWGLAAAASGSPALGKAVVGWKPALESGRTPSELVNDSHRFPDLFCSQYATGEISGSLDETLRRMHAYYQAEGSGRLHLVAQWVPRCIYFIIVLVIAYQVIKFWLGYFQQIENVMQPF